MMDRAGWWLMVLDDVGWYLNQFIQIIFKQAHAIFCVQQRWTMLDQHLVSFEHCYPVSKALFLFAFQRRGGGGKGERENKALQTAVFAFRFHCACPDALYLVAWLHPMVTSKFLFRCKLFSAIASCEVKINYPKVLLMCHTRKRLLDQLQELNYGNPQ